MNSRKILAAGLVLLSGTFIFSFAFVGSSPANDYAGAIQSCAELGQACASCEEARERRRCQEEYRKHCGDGPTTRPAEATGAQGPGGAGEA
ncbi:MAG: hypothetical protein DCC75_04270 [Proteobacteria bacterium]|nr:MAG: hypothetical protein DCC75_04270 [Pseudomonadota bacterium]